MSGLARAARNRLVGSRPRSWEGRSRRKYAKFASLRICGIGALSSVRRLVASNWGKRRVDASVADWTRRRRRSDPSTRRAPTPVHRARYQKVSGVCITIGSLYTDAASLLGRIEVRLPVGSIPRRFRPNQPATLTSRSASAMTSGDSVGILKVVDCAVPDV